MKEGRFIFGQHGRLCLNATLENFGIAYISDFPLPCRNVPLPLGGDALIVESSFSENKQDQRFTVYLPKRERWLRHFLCDKRTRSYYLDRTREGFNDVHVHYDNNHKELIELLQTLLQAESSLAEVARSNAARLVITLRETTLLRKDEIVLIVKWYYYTQLQKFLEEKFS